MFIRHILGVTDSGEIAGFVLWVEEELQARAQRWRSKSPPCRTKRDKDGAPGYVICGDRSGPTRQEDAGRGTRAFDALLGWALLRGQVPE